MKYRAEYDAKNQKMRIFVDDLPANKHEFDSIRSKSMPWCVVARSRPDLGRISSDPCPMHTTLAELKSDLDALDATRYKELSFTATAN